MDDKDEGCRPGGVPVKVRGELTLPCAWGLGCSHGMHKALR